MKKLEIGFALFCGGVKGESLVGIQLGREIDESIPNIPIDPRSSLLRTIVDR